jgi:exosortase/archaeosortase family protein
LDINGEKILIHWRLHKYLYILIAFACLVNINVFAELISDWYNDGNYSHGFLIIPVAVFLIWRKRKEMVFPARPSGWGIALFGFGGLGFILGTAASEFFTTRISILIIISGISLYYIGWENFRKVWFAFAILVFMVPVPAVIYYSATLPMQLISSKITNMVLHLLGMSSTRQGNIIYLPQYTLEVVPVILFIAAIPIAVLTNVARLILTAIVAYTLGGKYAEGMLHDTAGIVVFALAFILIIITGSVLKWLGKRS